MTLQPGPTMTLDEAVRVIRADPEMQDLVRDAHLGRDVADSYRRFAASAEFAEIVAILGGVRGREILDLGSGTGIAASAFAGAGARRVVAVEPDPSDEIGRGAMARAGLACEIVDAQGERLPFPDGSFDIVYCRQVLHHAADLDRLVAEVARVLRPGGTFLATREHVVRSPAELETFLAGHPEHVLAGGEHAFGLDEYVRAIHAARLVLIRPLGPWDSIVNTFPEVPDDAALHAVWTGVFRERFGRFAWLAARLPGARRRASLWYTDKMWVPGALYSFLCLKP